MGIFDKLEKSLSFDSDTINAIVKDLKLLKVLFKDKMKTFQGRGDFPVPLGGDLGGRNAPAPFAFTDKDVDTLISTSATRNEERNSSRNTRRSRCFYEIISPDALLRPYIDDYTTLSSIYEVVRKAYTKRVQVDREFQREDQRAGAGPRGSLSHERPSGSCEARRAHARTDQAEARRRRHKGDQSGEEHRESRRPCLVAMAERARAVQEEFEGRQKTTADALEMLFEEVKKNETRKNTPQKVCITTIRRPIGWE